MSDFIGPYLLAIEAENRSATTIEAKKELLTRLDRELPKGIDEASPREIRTWLANPEWSGNTRRTYWAHLSAFFKFCTKGRKPYIDWNPMEDIGRPHAGRRLPRVARDDQIHAVLTRLDHPAARRAVILAAGQGMRAAEIAVADRAHVTAKRVQVHGKGDKMRTVPTTPDVWSEVQHAEGRLVTINGRPIEARDLSRVVARALDRIGCPTLTLHWFRGAYATRLLRAGVDVTVISRLLGHSSVKTTMLYLDIVDDDLDAAVAKLPPLPMGTRAG
jgi:integrase/recombinase XerC